MKKNRPPGLRGWTELCSDVNWIDYHGMWAKRGPDGAYYVLRFTNLADAMGERDAREAGAIYECDVNRVDLAEIPDKEKARALECCGLDLEDVDSAHRDLATVECLVQYGCGAPLESFSSMTHGARVRADARRAAEAFMRDAVKLETALERPVNRIGSTAAEYGRGDLDSALVRHMVSGESDPTKDLMVKLTFGLVPNVATK